MGVHRVRSVLLLGADFLSVYEVVCAGLSSGTHHVRRQHAVALRANLVLVESHGHLRTTSSRASHTANHAHAYSVMVVVHVKDLLLLRAQVCGHLARSVCCGAMIHVGEAHGSRHKYIVVLALGPLRTTYILWIVLTALRHASSGTIRRLNSRRLHEVVMVLRHAWLVKVLVLLILLRVLIAIVSHVATVATDSTFLIVAVQVLYVEAASTLMITQAVTTWTRIKSIVLSSCAALRVQMLPQVVVWRLKLLDDAGSAT